MQASDLTLWIDYDRDKLTHLDPEQRIVYFERRVQLVAINPLSRILKTEIMVQDSSAVLIFGVSVCCAIEAAGKFYTGNVPASGPGANQERFMAFLRKYMSPEFKRGNVQGLTNGMALWKHFRNGLSHGFTVCHGGFEGQGHEPYIKTRTISNYQCLEINPVRFLDDFTAGFNRYVKDLRRTSPTHPLRTRFDHVFELVFVKGR